MIGKGTFAFLKGIKKNNSKTWFEEHKDEFIKERAEFKRFVEEIAGEVATFDPTVKNALDGQRTVKIFRIYRDVRFGKDKRPYKTNFGGGITPYSIGDGYAGYYIHIEPGNSFIGGGLHMPSTQVLGNIRDTIVKKPKKLETLIATKAFQDAYPEGLGNYDMLKTIPRGYDKEDPAREWLRYKSFTAMRSIADKMVTSPQFKNEVIKCFKAIKPLNDYLTDAAK